MESAKIDLPMPLRPTPGFDACIGNYGLLVSEESLVESCDTTIGTGGISLFNRVCGCFSLYFGNCQIAPSYIWRDMFECQPKSDDPFIWIDSTGIEVLHFERIASPVRELMREAYIRQPILFRWIAKKSWLYSALRNEGFRLYHLYDREQYPNLGEY